jgi:hypothetical protein
MKINVNLDRTCRVITVTDDDTWCTLCDKINEQILNDPHKSVYTGHYDHEMYYLSYVPKNGSTRHVSRCSTDGKPFDQINPDHIVYVNMALKNVRCCPCFIIRRDQCLKCSSFQTDDHHGGLVHNLYCGHELFCRQCADLTGQLDQCPICCVNQFKLVHNVGKCYKCHQFVHTSTCEFKLP